MLLEDVHARILKKSGRLSRMRVESAVDPLQLVRILQKAGISFVLVGAHGLGGWTRSARATEDVDFVVALKHVKKATRVLSEAFPHLEAEDHEVVVRFRERVSGDVVIDLMKPVQTLYRAAFKHVHVVEEGKLRYRIPTLEMALTMKFGAMLSPLRDDAKKHSDASDFIMMVRANPQIDDAELLELGELVYGGGGARLVEMVRQVRAGEKLVL